MRKRSLVNVISFGVLAILGTVSYVMLKPLISAATSAPPEVQELRLHGVVRDFRADHPDFDVVPDDGYGHYAGNVGIALGLNGQPVLNRSSDAGGAGDPHPIGNDTAAGTTVDHVKEKQIATRIDLPEDATLLSITGYVGNKDKDVRFALYDDLDGEPGTLRAETAAEESAKDQLAWLTLGTPEVELTAGSYWIALAFENDDHAYAGTTTSGEIRVVDHDATKEGFLETWGTSSMSATGRPSLSITVRPGVGSSAGAAATGGYKVLTEWRDAQGHPIAPHMFGAGVGGDDPIDFDIVDQGVIPNEDYAVKVTVLGAAIQTGSDGYHRPVTTRIHVGSGVFEPFGSFEDAVAGNLNDDQSITGDANGTNPRDAVIEQVFSADTPIWVTGRSWKLIDSDQPGTDPLNWEPKMSASTTDHGPQVKVLRHGDPVPDIAGLYDQDSIAEYVAEYVDTATGTMRLGVNEIIYLFEVGESGDSSTADFQDLVVIVTLASEPGDFPEGDELCGLVLQDDEGVAGPSSTGGITSTGTFRQWYSDRMGTNLSALHTIVLTRNADGVFEFRTDAFHPLDNRLFGNEGAAHNHHFTYVVAGTFEYARCADQFVEFEGSDDAWLFVDGVLAMDLGGVLPDVPQYVGIDRLGLQDGQRYEIRLFYAQRQAVDAGFCLRTNIPIEIDRTPSVITVGYD